MLNGLFLAWILSWFGFDQMVVDVLQGMTSIEVTTAHYYVIFGTIGFFFNGCRFE